MMLASQQHGLTRFKTCKYIIALEGMSSGFSLCFFGRKKRLAFLARKHRFHLISKHDGENSSGCIKKEEGAHNTVTFGPWH
jgi:hypothetical protein